jgi:hypothetical protein
MFKVVQELHPNPLVEAAYELDPRLQRIYNSIEEVTAIYPHVKRLYDSHIARADTDTTPRAAMFRLEATETVVSSGQFRFIGFVFVPK